MIADQPFFLRKQCIPGRKTDRFSQGQSLPKVSIFRRKEDLSLTQLYSEAGERAGNIRSMSENFPERSKPFPYPQYLRALFESPRIIPGILNPECQRHPTGFSPGIAITGNAGAG